MKMLWEQVLGLGGGIIGRLGGIAERIDKMQSRLDAAVNHIAGIESNTSRKLPPTF